MSAYWIKCIPGYRCSNCRMVSKTLEPACKFCESFMSNYENFLIEQLTLAENYSIIDIEKEGKGENKCTTANHLS